MSKKKKTKKRYNSNISTSNSKNPKVFFKKIGIRPLARPGEEGTIDQMDKEVQRRFGQNTINKVSKVYDDINPPNGFDVYHSDLRLAKIWYGANFYRICDIAARLAELSIPAKSKVLDIGGGPGHLAFWMANIWDVSSVMVTDGFPEVGIEWAANIKERRVNFINSTLPDLIEIGDEKFDLIVVSRVLSFMSELNLPESMPDFTIGSYLQSEGGSELFTKLVDIGKRLKDIVTPDGQVIIVDSWSDIRVMLIGKAFETSGLHINIEHFKPDKVGPEPSVIVFTESTKPIPLKDLPHSLSMAIKFPVGPPVYLGTAACTIQSFFKDGEIVDRFEFEEADEQLKGFTEIVEKEGLLLLFKATNRGIHNAWIYPGIYIQYLLEVFEEMKEEHATDILQSKSMKPEPLEQVKVITDEHCLNISE
jgi:2-polyprenyl-3-methyl-5-hydroxy-6-metoxy-1,4-benzoquinol methylase